MDNFNNELLEKAKQTKRADELLPDRKKIYIAKTVAHAGA